MNASQLLPAPRTAASRRLLELARRHDELRGELSALRRREAEDAERLKMLAAELAEAEARERAGVLGADEAAVRSARARVAKVQKTTTEREPELRVMAGALEAVEVELKRHATEHYGALETEMGEHGAEVAERLRAAVLELGGAVAAYREAGVRAAGLQILGRPELARVRRVPEVDHELHRLGRQAPALAAAIRVPVPTSQATGLLTTAAG